MENPTVLMKAEEIARTLDRLAFQILEKRGTSPDLALIGIQRRGADLAARIAAILSTQLQRAIPCGALDITLYRDDWTSVGVRPTVGSTKIQFSIQGRDLILIDDVLFTTRTVRAAMEALLDFGRPRRVELLALVDRGHHELPIHADYIGRSVNTAHDERVDVLLVERDGIDEVRLTSR